MTSNPYVRFLPNALREAAGVGPEHTWWDWEGHRVNIARARRPDSPCRLLVIHGAGGHAGALWPLAAVLAGRGLDVTAVDLPLYGRTVAPRPREVRYDDWIRLLKELIDAEDDGRPLVLLGASIGGLLACEVASVSYRVSEVVATCLLDPGDWRARARMTRFGFMGVLAKPLSFLARGPIASVMIPVGWVAKLSKMSRNPELSTLCATDPLGGAARVPLGFLGSYMRYRHRSPETISVPVTLAHPAEDAWTPVGLSMRVLGRIRASTNVVLLPECGHFPVEEPGISTLLDTVEETMKRAEA